MRSSVILASLLFLSLSGVSLNAHASLPDERRLDILMKISDASLEAQPQSDEFMPQVASSDHVIYFPAKSEEIVKTQAHHFGWLLLASLASVLSALALRRLPKAVAGKIKS